MLLYLKIKPNQRFARVEGSVNNWVIKIKAPAIEGKANEHLVSYLSKIFNLPKSKILLKKGKTSPLKCLEIDAQVNYINECLIKASLNLHNTL